MLTFLLGSLIGTLFGYCLARWMMWREREHSEVVAVRKRAEWVATKEVYEWYRKRRQQGPYRRGAA